jgi:DNA-binding GntR family transcriptional regulator
MSYTEGRKATFGCVESRREMARERGMLERGGALQGGEVQAETERQRPGEVLADVEVPDETTLAERAYHAIEELIVTLRLPPSTVLSEQVLAKRLDIGRTPVREALQRLARDGLVTILPRRGILVSEINVRVQLRLLEVRRELERLMARLAAERASVSERQIFARLAADMLKASHEADDLAFMRLDQQFNHLLAEASQNEFAKRSMGLLNGLSRRFWFQHYKEAADLPHTAKLHAAIAKAIADRNSQEAASASDRLVDYIESFARKTLET